MEERQSPKLIMGVRFTQLLPMLPSSNGLGYRPFTAVIRVRLSSGVPFEELGERLKPTVC